MNVYYFGAGTKRHIERERTGMSVTMWCGLRGQFGFKVAPTQVEATCRYCLRALERES